MSKNEFATDALHAGHDTIKTQGTRAVPIYQTTSYVFDNSQHAADLFSLAEPGYIYTRLNNPTNDILEQRLATLDGGIGAVAMASGTAAIATGLLTLLRSGDHIVASNSLYGGTFNMLNVTLPRFDIKTSFVEGSVESIKKAINEKTKVIFLEALGNPKLDILDIEAIAKLAEASGIPLFVDNTIPTPALFKPLDYGANVVLYSLTKYIGGHGNSLGGAVVDGGTFDWANGKFPEFTTPSAGYHGLIYHEALGAASYLAKLRIEGLRDFGGAPSPYNSFNIIQGLETLNLRIQKHSENALDLAQWLEKHPKVSWVNYPGLPSSKYHSLAKKYLSKGQSGILTFGLKSGFEGAKIVADETKLFSLLANIGDTKSLIIHPASTTHQQLSVESQKASGVTQELIRISTGLENIEDLKKDLQQAMDKIR